MKYVAAIGGWLVGDLVSAQIARRVTDRPGEVFAIAVVGSIAGAIVAYRWAK